MVTRVRPSGPERRIVACSKLTPNIVYQLPAPISTRSKRSSTVDAFEDVVRFVVVSLEPHQRDTRVSRRASRSLQRLRARLEEGRVSSQRFPSAAQRRLTARFLRDRRAVPGRWGEGRRIERRISVGGKGGKGTYRLFGQFSDGAQKAALAPGLTSDHPVANRRPDRRNSAGGKPLAPLERAVAPFAYA